MHITHSRLSYASAAALAGLALLGSACDGSRSTTGECSPDRSRFDSEIRPLVERYCGSCHGDMPDFGAPVSLLDIDELLATGVGGERLVEHIAHRLADGTMPPVGMPRLPEADADAIAAWASCGEVDVPAQAGLVSSASPFLAPPTAPEGLATLDIVADEHAIGPDVRDEYACFAVDLDVPAERFVRRFEMIYDETRVLHHIILTRDTERRTTPGYFACNGGGAIVPGSEYLFTWAPGQSALELPGGGLRVAPGDRFVLQIHYNNGIGLPDVRDSSGVRLFLGPTEGIEYGMLAFGPTAIELPPRMRTAVTGTCTVETPMTILAGMPHMHGLGSELSQTRVRGAERTDLITLRGWQFETQLFYALPFTLEPGDVVETRCTYTNTSDETVRFGENTSDEMCHNFVYVTPPPTSVSCDDGNPDRPTDIEHTPGECAPPGSSGQPPLVRGAWAEVMEPPTLSGGTAADGRYELVSMTMFGTGGDTPLGALDFGASYTLARGRLGISSGALSFDVDTDAVVIIGSGTRFGMPASESFTVPFDGSGDAVDARETCPGAGAERQFDWGVEGDELVLGFTRTDVPGMTLWPRYRFRRAP